jgi:Uma2 family endonuclease
MSAATLTQPKLYTADDLLEMPDDCRFELIRGELIEMPPSPGGEHGYTTISIAAYASVYVMERGLGFCFAAETGFKVSSDPDVVLAPDFAFVAKDRLPDGVTKKHVPLAPDLVMETRSPSDRKRDVATKMLLWLQAGVKEVWILEPSARTLTIHRTGEPPRVLGANDTLGGGDILPGFTFALSRLFPPLPTSADEPPGDKMP